jgi:DNA mismatch repair ATPase MutS
MRLETNTAREINYLRNRIRINEKEIDLLNHHYEKFNGGVEFLEPQHPFSSDLDLFGRRSIFQLLNRTVTHTGRQKLASLLLAPPLDKKEIKERQRAVQELSTMSEWCQNFMAQGLDKKELAQDKEIISGWLGEKNHFSSLFYSVCSYLLPVLSILSLTLYLTGVTGYSPFLICASLQFLVVLPLLKHINSTHQQFSRKFDSIEKYRALITLIESARFEAPALLVLQAQLKEKNIPANRLIHRLKRLSDALDLRQNLVLTLLLNGILLWDINVMKRIETWRSCNKEQFSSWIEMIGRIDVYISLAAYSYNNPEYVFPEIHETGFLIDAQETGHPLIDPLKLVKNNYYMEGQAKIDLLTGANMAGKSTFLRTIGANLILAMTGAPVCAKTFRFSPVKLFTSLRTNDSLQENESFFYAELKRLHMLIEYYSQGIPVFFLLDEILKGTNSKDQHSGSVALIHKILRLNGTGIIATHDVALSSLSVESPDQVRNICFEISIAGDKLIFDYILREGVCQKMNASFLLKKMGITD